jgi:hypothetical protein
MRSDPGQQVARGAGRDEVVVRPGPKASATRFSTGGRRQDDDRHNAQLGLSAQGREQAKSINSRQEYLGQYKIGLLPLGRRDPRLTVGDRRYLISVFVKQAVEIDTHAGTAFGHQHAWLYDTSG